MSLEEVKRRRSQQVIKKKPQWGYAVFIVMILIFLQLTILKESPFSIVLWLGIATGLVLQRSKICFAASFRDIFLFKKTKVQRAIIGGMIVATIGFGIVQWINIKNGVMMAQQVEPIGLHTVVGGILFGIGMVISGGCIAGTFVRIGEGYLLQVLTFIGMIIGTGLAMFMYPWWLKTCIQRASPVYLGDYIPLPFLIIVQVTFLLLIYWALAVYERRKP